MGGVGRGEGGRWYVLQNLLMFSLCNDGKKNMKVYLVTLVSGIRLQNFRTVYTRQF